MDIYMDVKNLLETLEHASSLEFKTWMETVEYGITGYHRLSMI